MSELLSSPMQMFAIAAVLVVVAIVANLIPSKSAEPRDRHDFEGTRQAVLSLWDVRETMSRDSFIKWLMSLSMSEDDAWCLTREMEDRYNKTNKFVIGDDKINLPESVKMALI